MLRNGKSELHRELSWFLIAYLLMILGALLGVHLLQFTLEHASGASPAPPAGQDRPTMSRRATGTDFQVRASVR